MTGADRTTGLRASALTPATIVLAAAASLTAGAFLPAGGFRAVVTLPLAVIVPGYSIARVALAGRHRLGNAPSVALFVIISLAFYPLVAAALHVASIRLSLASVVVPVDAVAAAAALVEWRRRRSSRALLLAGGRVDQPAGADLPADEQAGRRPVPWLLFVGSLGCSIAVLVVAAAVLPRPAPPPYSELYLAGEWSRHSEVAPIPAGRNLSVSVGVGNHTGRRQRYVLRASLTGARAWPARVILVDRGRTWVGAVSGPVPQAKCLRRLEISLSEGPSHDKVATVVVWLGPPDARPCVPRVRRTK